MNILRSASQIVFSAFLFGFTAYATAGDKPMKDKENNESVIRNGRYENSPMTTDEKSFLYSIHQKVAADDQKTDYQKLIERAPTDHKGIFWYECAVALSELPESGEMDLRDNGRLFVALGILSNMLKNNPSSPQILAQRMIVLNYLAHGYSAVSNNQFMEDSVRKEFAKRSRTMAKILIDSSFEAIKRFPKDDWFKSTHEAANQDFGYLFERKS